MTHDHRTMVSGDMPCHCVIVRMLDHGPFLGIREAAATVRGRVSADLNDGRTVVLDFAGVEAITNGYADELVAKLRAQHGDRIRWENTNPEVADAITTALTRRAPATIHPRS